MTLTMSTPSELLTEISSAFSNVGLRNVQQDLLSQCMGLCRTYDITPLQLAMSWEAFALNKNTNPAAAAVQLTPHTFAAYRTCVLKEYDSAVMTSRPMNKNKRAASTEIHSTSSHTVTPDAKRLATSSESRRVSISPSVQNTQTTTQQHNLNPTMIPTQLPRYQDRKDSGKVVAFHRATRTLSSASTTTTTTTTTCAIHGFETNLTRPYRHQFTTLDKKGAILDQLLQADFDIPDDAAPLEAVGVPRPDAVTCIGRICNEAHEGRINSTSILLEGSRHASNGIRIAVDLTQLKENCATYSLFPGQIVAVEGMNTTGRKLVAHRIFASIHRVPTVASATPRDPSDKVRATTMSPIHVMMACGPYTCKDSREYAPLLDLLELVRVQRPHALILQGPFCTLDQEAVLEAGDGDSDSDHSSLLHVPYDVFFANKVTAVLEELVERDPTLPTQFILQPSTDDACGTSFVYPQAPFPAHDEGVFAEIAGGEGIELHSLGFHHVGDIPANGSSDDEENKEQCRRRIHCVPNPCTLQLNRDVVIGMTSTDVLFDLSSHETNAQLPPGSRLTRLAQHLLEQGNYYPLFPTPATINMDLSQFQDHVVMPVRPNVLIVPSKLSCLARRVVCDSSNNSNNHHTVVVNPGRLTKGTAGGTYATLAIGPPSLATMTSEKEDVAGAADRLEVQVKKI